jgi:DNA (cytosine-5)-methyltransferase 1
MLADEMKLPLKLNEFKTIRDAANELGVHPDTLRRWQKNGKLKAYRHPINQYRLYHLDDLRKLLTEVCKL